MKKNNKKVLIKAEEYLKKYEKDDSIYYNELKKTYKEYKNMDFKDQVTNDLYIEHISSLCEFIKHKNQSSYIITLLILFIFFIILLAGYSTYKYYNLSNEVKRNLLNKSVVFNVNYKNIEGFSANTLSTPEEYENLTPLTLSIIAKSKNNKTSKVHYDVYLIEDNDSISKSNLLSKDIFLYNVKSSKKDGGIKALKDAFNNNHKLLIFSGEINTNEEENIDIRMWIDSHTKIDYINKKYRFKIYIDGYMS